MRIACCIVAAGQGTRLGEEWVDSPKALIPVLGRPMLYYSLAAFDKVEQLSRFAVAAPPNAVEEFREYISDWGFSHKIDVVAGGATRSESVVNALRALSDDSPKWVLIHDAGRPCVTSEMVEVLIEASQGQNVATLAHRATDTLRTVHEKLIVEEVDRSRIACLETPQLFPYARLLELHEQTSAKDELPDDTTLITRAGERVKVAYHTANNAKVTFPEDIPSVEGILFQRGWVDVSEGGD